MRARRLHIIGVGIAAAVALCLGACNPAEQSALGGLQPVQTANSLSPESMTAAGVPQATQTKITAAISKVRAAASTICGVLPFAEGVANVFIANNNVYSNVQGIANLTCRAFDGAASYASLGDRAGQRVKGHLSLNGHELVLYGTRTR